MSASNKKKLRKEQNTAAMTEKQRSEMKEAKKLKNYTLTFFVAMGLVVAIVIGVLLRVPVATLINRNTVALTIDNQELGAVQLNYYYADAVSDYYSELEEIYSDQANLYAQWFYNLNFSQSMDDQIYDKETGETWGQHFLKTAIENAKTAYALYTQAMEKGHKVSEEDQQDIDITIESLELAASYSGFSSTTAYVRSLYGPGATAETFAEYYKINKIASSYYASIVEELGDKLTDKDFRDHEKDKVNNFTSYSYNIYTVGMADYMTGGTKNDKGEVTYSEAEKKAAREAAKEAAKELSSMTFTSIEEFDKAIAAMPANKDKKDVASTETKNVLFTNISDERLQKWISDSSRKAFDVTMLAAEATTTDADGKEVTTVNGYYVIVFTGARDNKMPLANVRHLLVMFKGGTTDSNGNKTYSDAEKETAKKTAEELLEQWKSGKKTEDSFAELAKEKSDDSGTKSKGGLIEEIYPDANMVESFLDWCFDGHKAGDTGIIESEYGYHIMYYVGDAELTYRDLLIKTEMVTESSTKWLEELVKKLNVVENDLSRVFYDYTPV